MLDEYVWGDVSRISPEAPVQILTGIHRENKSGGAGSVVENLAMLGAKVDVCGLVGTDPAGGDLLEMLAKKCRSEAGLIVSTSRPTTRKTRFLGSVQHAHRGQQQLLRVDWEQVLPPTVEERRRIGGFLDQTFVDPPAVILLSDYEKGLLSEDVIQDIIRRARDSGVRVLVDPGRTVDYSRYRGAFLICPNRFEAEHATGMRLQNRTDYERAGKFLVETLALQHAVLTLDREGIFLVGSNGQSTQFETEPRAVTDVAGAGDMVLSLLGLGLAAGWEIDETIRLANLGAGIEVSKVGVTPIELWEIEQAVSESAVDSLSKVRKLEELMQITERARAAGKRIVFTNGCFDVLHLGHVYLLEKARALGDMLVVGLNSDASIRRLKGRDRPVYNGHERSRLLSALTAVDHVVFFDDDTPVEVIAGIRPNILVKGSDYQDKDVIGRDLVERGGGRVEFVPVLQSVSTTSILERIRQDRSS